MPSRARRPTRPWSKTPSAIPTPARFPASGTRPTPRTCPGSPAWHVHAGTTLCRVTTSGLGPVVVLQRRPGTLRPGAAPGHLLPGRRRDRRAAGGPRPHRGGQHRLGPPPQPLVPEPARPVPGRRHHRAARPGFGVTAELASITPYDLPQQWAAAFARAGYQGVRYRVRHDPGGSRALALFGPAGERPGGRWAAAAPWATHCWPGWRTRPASPWRPCPGSPTWRRSWIERIGAARRRGRRGARRPRARPLPLAGGRRRPRHPGLGGGRERPHPGRPRRPPGAGRAGGPVHRPVLGRHRGAPSIRGGRLFSIDRWPGHEQAVLVVRDAHGDGPPAARTLLDPHEATGDPTAALDWYSPSKDGRLVAYGISTGGDERSTLGVLDVATGEPPGGLDPPHPGRLGQLGARRDGVRLQPLPGPGGGGRGGGQLQPHDPVAHPGRRPGPRRGGVRRPPGQDGVAVGRAVPGRPLVGDRGVARLDPGRRPRHRPHHRGAHDRHRGHRGGVVVHGGRRPPRGHDHPRRPAGPGGGPLASPTPEHWHTVVAESGDVVEGVAVTAGTLLVATTRRATSRLGRIPLAALDGDGPVVPDDIPLPEPGSLAGVAGDRDSDTAVAVLSRRGPGRPSCGGGRPPSRAATASAGGATWPPPSTRPPTPWASTATRPPTAPRSRCSPCAATTSCPGRPRPRCSPATAASPSP